MLNRSASLVMSTIILKALPGKLDIKDTHLLYYSPSNGTLIFGNTIKSKMRILYLIGNIYTAQQKFSTDN